MTKVLLSGEKTATYQGETDGHVGGNVHGIDSLVGRWPLAAGRGGAGEGHLSGHHNANTNAKLRHVVMPFCQLFRAYYSLFRLIRSPASFSIIRQYPLHIDCPSLPPDWNHQTLSIAVEPRHLNETNRIITITVLFISLRLHLFNKRFLSQSPSSACPRLHFDIYDSRGGLLTPHLTRSFKVSPKQSQAFPSCIPLLLDFPQRVTRPVSGDSPRQGLVSHQPDSCFHLQHCHSMFSSNQHHASPQSRISYPSAFPFHPVSGSPPPGCGIRCSMQNPTHPHPLPPP